jgi:hypothetical protein
MPYVLEEEVCMRKFLRNVGSLAVFLVLVALSPILVVLALLVLWMIYG